jgi:hypothetical protein
VIFICASLVAAMVALGPTSRAPSLVPGDDSLRAAPALIGIAAAAAPAAHKQHSAFRLSPDVDVSVITLMKSLGGATYYRVAPGVALGAGSSVAALDLPGGQVRALQFLAVLRFKF